MTATATATAENPEPFDYDTAVAAYRAGHRTLTSQIAAGAVHLASAPMHAGTALLAAVPALLRRATGSRS